MTIKDLFKKRIAQQHRLNFKICWNCGARNPPNAVKCRKCRSKKLRKKNKELGAK
jgi:large subunit ribosomal protein L40e